MFRAGCFSPVLLRLALRAPLPPHRACNLSASALTGGAAKTQPEEVILKFAQERAIHPLRGWGGGGGGSGGGFGSPLWWDWGWERWISCPVKVGDETGQCYLSLRLRRAHEKLNEPVVFQCVWFIGAINFWTGGHPFALSDWQPLVQPRLAAVSVNSVRSCHISCLLAWQIWWCASIGELFDLSPSYSPLIRLITARRFLYLSF